jgi:hypothetical protein
MRTVVSPNHRRPSPNSCRPVAKKLFRARPIGPAAGLAMHLNRIAHQKAREEVSARRESRGR